jgi:hypothetical protein
VILDEMWYDLLTEPLHNATNVIPTEYLNIVAYSLKECGVTTASRCLAAARKQEINVF